MSCQLKGVSCQLKFIQRNRGESARICFASVDDALFLETIPLFLKERARCALIFRRVETLLKTFLSFPKKKKQKRRMSFMNLCAIYLVLVLSKNLKHTDNYYCYYFSIGLSQQTRQQNIGNRYTALLREIPVIQCLMSTF